MSRVFEIRVRGGGQTYLARHDGQTASNTSGAIAAARTVLRKAYGEAAEGYTVTEAKPPVMDGKSWVYTIEVRT